MGNEVKDAGFKAGTEGKTSNDNPHSTGPIERLGGAVGTILSGGLIDPIGDNDRNAADWESARQAGENSQKNNR